MIDYEALQNTQILQRRKYQVQKRNKTWDIYDRYGIGIDH